MSKINFVRASLTKTQYATNFLNKTKKKSINKVDESENYVLTTQETPISCITAEQDFNYFLAKGCRKEIVIDNYAIGFPFTQNFSVNSSFAYNGAISYTIKPGKILRSGLTLWGKFVLIPRITSTTYHFPVSNSSFSATTYFF